MDGQGYRRIYRAVKATIFPFADGAPPSMGNVRDDPEVCSQPMQSHWTLIYATARLCPARSPRTTDGEPGMVGDRLAPL